MKKRRVEKGKGNSLDGRAWHQILWASVTNDHKLGVSDNRYVFSHISADKTFRTSMTGMK